MELNLTTTSGQASSEHVEVSDELFGRDFNEALIHQVVTAYLAVGRFATRAHKSRAMVRGGGSKPWRQKGTGRARAGSIRSPLWRGGGKTFVAQGENYTQKINKKMYRNAMRSIMSELVRQERLVVVPELKVTSPKTKEFANILKGLGIVNGMIITIEADENLNLASRNIPKIEVLEVKDVNPICLIKPEKVVITVGALKQVEEMLA